MVKHRVIGLMRHPLIAGSSIVFIGSFGASILAYVFNLVIGRILSPAEFGLLTTLTSLTVLFSVIQQSYVGIFAKFSARYKATDNEEDFSKLLVSGTRFVVISALILLIISSLSITWLSPILKVDNPVFLFMIFTAIAFSIIFSFPYGVLQGELQFKTIAFFNLLPQFIKIALGVSLVFAGYQVFGVIIAVFVSALIPLVLGMSLIRRRYGLNKNPKASSKEFFEEFRQYSIYFFLATLGIAVISNMDIVLVRIFFEPIVSGQYAALSLMGKAIFYLTSPIYFVFFPIIAQKKERNEVVLQTLLFAVSIVTVISAAAAFGYFLFPKLVLTIFFPAPEYQVLIPYLGPYALFVLIFSIANLFNNYFLSMGNTGVYKINLTIAFIFILLIAMFHSSLYQVIGVLFTSAFFLLVLYMIYYYRIYHGKN